LKKPESHAELLSSHQPDAVAERLQQPPKVLYISDAVLGAIDGCVTTFAIVSGAVGAGFGGVVAIVLGIANLTADGFSMAVSNYQATKAHREHREEIRRIEERHIDEIPEGEREELRQIFRKKGFHGEVLEEIVATISKDRQLWIETMLTEEYGLPKTTAEPWRAALATFLAFVLVGAVPLVPFLFTAATLQQQFTASIVLAALMFFGIGLAKGAVIGRPMLRSGIGTLLMGSGAASLAYAVGYLLRETFAVT
jgi:vacuolar iron transporter family protein